MGSVRDVRSRDEVIGEARALLDTVGKIETSSDVTTVEQDEEQLEKAEAALWGWYLEWSRIARIAVTQRARLRHMGFIQTQSKADVVEEPSTSDAAASAPGGLRVRSSN